MGYSNEIFEQALAEIEKRRTDAENTLDRKMELFEKTEPEYRQYKIQMIQSVQDAIAAINLPKEELKKKLAAAQEANLNAQAVVKRLLEKNHLPEDYLTIKYHCPVCSDTGSNGTKICDCMIEILKKLTFDEEGKKSPLKFSRFEDFSLNYYSDAYSDELKSSPRQRMSDILEFCKAYAAGFDKDSTSIFMYGETGLGKTHLSLAIAAEVIEKGYTVIYNSAQNILSRLNAIQFQKINDTTFEPMLLECNLLVIDDLGAEFQTTFTQACVYNIINTRINSGLPTIISSNIELKDIAGTYSKRISSRIIGDYDILKFVGEDVRQQRKNEN